MASIRRERGEARRASQAFRDLGMLLFLLLLLFSVRFPDDEAAEPTVNPRPGGVQAAGHEQAEPAVVEPSVVPALATPAAPEAVAPPIATLQEPRHEIETQVRVLVLTEGAVRTIRLPAHITVRDSGSSCSDRTVERLTRS